MSELSTFSDKSDHKIAIKEYDPKYSTKLSLLATTVDEIKLLGGMIQAKKIFNSDYHAKIQKYKDSVIIFAEDKNNTEATGEGLVCGSVELGIKEAYVNGQICKVGVVSDLRVLPQYRRLGVGTKLIEQIEIQGKQKGVNFFYFLLSQGSEKSKDIFEKQGYIPGNEVNMLTFELSSYTKSQPQTKIGSEEVQFQEITKARAKELLQQYYDKKDFFAKDVNEYLENPNYEGTYVVETANGDTYGGINVYSNPSETKMLLQKFFVPTDYAYNRWAHIPVMSVVSLFAATFYFVLNGRFGVNPKTSATITIGLNIGFLLAYTRLMHSIRRHSGRDPNCRYVGMFYHGKEEMKKDIFGLLFSNLEHMSYNKGYRLANMNLEKGDSLKKFIPGGENYLSSRLYYKLENKDQQGEITSKGFNNFSFIDPRDW